jgi:hypothetical protein
LVRFFSLVKLFLGSESLILLFLELNGPLELFSELESARRPCDVIVYKNIIRAFYMLVTTSKANNQLAGETVRTIKNIVSVLIQRVHDLIQPLVVQSTKMNCSLRVHALKWEAAMETLKMLYALEGTFPRSNCSENGFVQAILVETILVG